MVGTDTETVTDDVAVTDRRMIAVVTALVAAGVFSMVIVLLLADRAAADSHDQGEIFDFGITVPEAPLTVGDSLTFTNTGARPHTATDRGGMLNTGPIRPGESDALTFDVPGTYELFCEINPSTMNATVVVLPADDPPDQVRVQAFDEARDGAAKSFDRPALEVRPGAEVILANVGGLPHTLTARDGSFTTEVVEPGREDGRFAGRNGSFVAPEAGSYEFFCEIHPEAMQGVLTVAGRPLDAPPPEREPPPDDIEEVAAGAEAEASIDVIDLDFDPDRVVVLPGAALTWTNSGDLPHTATFDNADLGLDTGQIEPGGFGTLTAPAQPGSYAYLCEIHPQAMQGVLVVTPPDAAPGADDDPDPPVAGDADDATDAADEVAAPPDDDGGTSGGAVAAAAGLLLAGLVAIALALFARRHPDTDGPHTDGGAS